MPRWVVTADGHEEGDPLAVIESYPDGSVSMHMPSSEPVRMTTRKLEEIRLAAGAAIGDARVAGRCPE